MDVKLHARTVYERNAIFMPKLNTKQRGDPTEH